MHGKTLQADSRKVQRLELILQEFDSLPTLGAVAVRLLELTTDEESDAQEVIDLVASDPALASKVLKLCRCHDRGRASRVTTIERAVLQLGFEAIRCAVLSARVFEIVDEISSATGESHGGQPVFDREAFWLHALGGAVVSSRIASRATRAENVAPGEAFMAGLLHDIGQLVLHVLLPETFDQVCRMAETVGASLDRTCQEVIGLDTHTAGKRLAEHWGLPRSLVDVIWLSGQPFEALPPVPHRSLIALVSLADALVRDRYISAGGHPPRQESLSTLCVPVGISPDALDEIAQDLHDEVSARASALGLRGDHDSGLLLRCLCRANDTLARANAGMRRRTRIARRQERVLETITQFCDTLPTAASVADVLARIGVSAQDALETRVPIALYEAADALGWKVLRLTADGRPYGGRLLDPPPHAISLSTLVRDVRLLAPALGLMPWLVDALDEPEGLDDLQMLALATGRERGNAILLMQPPAVAVDEGAATQALVRCWQSALAGGIQHDSAGHLAEQLAGANRTLLEAQVELSRSRTLNTLGEVAAGAAHEMNNPLTIISGRSQLLAYRAQDPEQRTMALEIADQAHRLSDMITALRSFAEPVTPEIQDVNVADLVLRVVQRYGHHERRQPQINTVLTDALPTVRLDPQLIGPALGELLKNAVEAKGAQHIELRVQSDPHDRRLKMEIRDDGTGLNDHALEHAFDPFYSAKPAGRQPGLGLARARRFVEAHDGRITLVNGPSGGAVATLLLPLRPAGHSADAEAA